MLNFEIQITVTPSSDWFQEENTIQECLVLHHPCNLMIQIIDKRISLKEESELLGVQQNNQI
jgi:hypothetical protein